MVKNFHAYLLSDEKISWCAVHEANPCKFRRAENAGESTVKFFTDLEMYKIKGKQRQNSGRGAKAWQKVEFFWARNVEPYEKWAFREGKQAPTFHIQIRSGNIRKIRERRTPKGSRGWEKLFSRWREMDVKYRGIEKKEKIA